MVISSSFTVGSVVRTADLSLDARPLGTGVKSLASMTDSSPSATEVMVPNSDSLAVPICF